MLHSFNWILQTRCVAYATFSRFDRSIPSPAKSADCALMMKQAHCFSYLFIRLMLLAQYMFSTLNHFTLNGEKVAFESGVLTECARRSFAYEYCQCGV